MMPRSPADGRPWRLIAFDLDDTLYPETAYVRSGFRAVSLWLGQRLACDDLALFDELNEIFLEGIRGTIFDILLEKRGLSRSLIPEMVNVYRRHTPDIEPFVGVQNMLNDLKHDHRLGIVSDGLLAVQRNKLDALGIRDFFNTVIFSDEFGRDSWKPSTRPFIELLKAVGVSPGEAVYVGDNPIKDFIPCRQLGMQSIWIRQSEGIYSDLIPTEENAPDHVVGSIASLQALLRARCAEA